MGTINKTSERFNNAVTKLYNAFHNRTLSYGSCYKCAVGSMCDGNSDWSRVFCGITDDTTIENQIHLSNYKGYVKDVIDRTGYSVIELANIEFKFMEGSYNAYTGKCTENFNGLCKVVEYLCELEGIPNVMDYSKLFETENNEPKYKLENVLV